jgi:hypothetical protein
MPSCLYCSSPTQRSAARTVFIPFVLTACSLGASQYISNDTYGCRKVHLLQHKTGMGLCGIGENQNMGVMSKKMRTTIPKQWACLKIQFCQQTKPVRLRNDGQPVNLDKQTEIHKYNVWSKCYAVVCTSIVTISTAVLETVPIFFFFF